MFDHQTWPPSTRADASLPGSPNSSDALAYRLPTWICCSTPSAPCGWSNIIKYHKISVKTRDFQWTDWWLEILKTGFSGILNGMISIFFVHPRLNSFRGYYLRSNIWPKIHGWVLQSPMAKITILKWLQWPQKRPSQANMMVVNGGFNDQTRGV